MIRNPRIMTMDLMIICKESNKYTWNILIVNFIDEHFCYIYEYKYSFQIYQEFRTFYTRGQHDN